MSSTRLLILGVVRWFQPVHGYDVRRELLSWHADEWANVQPGSIYHALKKLAEEGLLREVATEQVGGRPARTTYEITPKGEDEFQDLLNRSWWDHKPALDPFAKIPEFKYCAIRVSLGGEAPLQGSYGGGQALRNILAASAA